ncbi:hypothetical protein SSX86_014763 [Deinandra increscens subsp. villosa]|uniref:DUF241 domain protein n=1 Tax=Deinandra increscens subsp. villosa TaxID=3103831 RepID=A0AAP0DA16_9ASTR
MACSYLSNHNTYGVRSISLSATPNLSTDSIKKELNGIETLVMSPSSCKPSLEAIYDGLMRLSRLYECTHELINLLCTCDKKWVEDLLDILVGFLDVCETMREIMSRYKEHVRDLECALRRRKGDSSIESSIARYNSFRKTVKKDVKRLMASLKRSMVAKSQDRHCEAHHEVVIKMVMEETVSIFECLLMAFVMPNTQVPKTCKWSMVVSKLIQRTRVACEEHHYHQTNDIGSLDVVLHDRCVKVDRCSSWWNDACILEAMETQIGRIGDGLECIFRSLIRTRVSLLNIVSNY